MLPKIRRRQHQQRGHAQTSCPSTAANRPAALPRTSTPACALGTALIEDATLCALATAPIDGATRFALATAPIEDATRCAFGTAPIDRSVRGARFSGHDPSLERTRLHPTAPQPTRAALVPRGPDSSTAIRSAGSRRRRRRSRKSTTGWLPEAPTSRRPIRTAAGSRPRAEARAHAVRKESTG
jgi:hypothetical protein